MFSTTQTLRTTLWALIGALVLLGATWLGAGRAVLDSENFLPHGVCYTWNPTLIGLHVVSDALIGLAYFSIPVAILFLTRKRRDLPFSWIFLLFGIFIVACGATHWMEVWTLWTPNYWLSGIVKAITAAASVPTAAALVFLMPKALALPSMAQLREAKAALEGEIEERKRVEKELRDMQTTLEHRVTERTAELQRTNVELNDQRRALREADKQKDRFLAILAHELRNPLNAVHVAVEVLKRKADLPDDVRRVRDVIDRQMRRFTRLLDDLLDVARIAQDKLTLKLEPLELSSVIALAVEGTDPLFAAKDQRVSIDMPPESTALSGDQARLAQVIGNVLNNASQYTDRGGSIVVTVRRDGASALVSVRDSGRGIAKEELRHVFDLFRQGHTDAAHDGLGVGLGLAKRLVEMHGGTIEAHSEGVGTGTEIRIRLPLLQADFEPDRRAAPRAIHDTRRLRILVADDNLDARDTLAELLEQEGHEVIRAGDGSEALEKLLALEPDVGILDIGMPRLNGYKVAEALRAQRRGSDIQLIAVTGYGQQADKARAEQAGFDAHLTKPVDLGELTALLALPRRRIG